MQPSWIVRLTTCLTYWHIVRLIYFNVTFSNNMICWMNSGILRFKRSVSCDEIFISSSSTFIKFSVILPRELSRSPLNEISICRKLFSPFLLTPERLFRVSINCRRVFNEQFGMENKGKVAEWIKSSEAELDFNQFKLEIATKSSLACELVNHHHSCAGNNKSIRLPLPFT